LPQQFKEVKDFYDFDKKLGADQKDFKKFVKQLSSIGEKSRQKCVTNMVNRMMSNPSLIWLVQKENRLSSCPFKT